MPGGVLVTNAHVTSALCPGGSCEGLIVSRSPAIGSHANDLLNISRVQIAQEIPALDVGFLKLEGADLPAGYFDSAEKAEQGGKVFALGYPKCGALTLSEGYIGAGETTKFLSTTRAAHGSSGSPLFTPNFKLVGVAQESETLVGGFLSMFSDHTFDTVALRADLALDLQEASQDTLLMRQAEYLLANYREGVRTLPGFRRLRSAVSFFAAVEGLRDLVLFSPGRESETKVMAALGQYLDYIPRLREMPRPELIQRLESLVLAYNIELKGANQQFLVPAHTESIFRSLQRDFIPQRQREEFTELINFAIRDGYQGMELFSLLWGASIAAITAVLLIVLSWSMGYVFAGMQGSIIKRFLASLAALLVWPIPVIIIWWGRRTRGRGA